MDIYDGFVYILYFEEQGDSIKVFMSDNTTIYTKNTFENKEKLLKQMKEEQLEITKDGKIDKIRKNIISNKNLAKIDIIISTYAFLLSLFVPSVIKIILGLLICFLAGKTVIEIKNFKELEVTEKTINDTITFIKSIDEEIKNYNNKKNSKIINDNKKSESFIKLNDNISSKTNEETKQKIRVRTYKK